MQPVNTHVFVATLGSQPQIITLMLDRLLPQYPVTVVHAVHTHSDAYRQATSMLRQEFLRGQYNDKPCALNFTSIRYHDQPVSSLDSEDALYAARDTFERLFAIYKEKHNVIHLCLTGGPRLLGHIALSAAQEMFDSVDRVWHLYSSEPVRESSQNGRQMHFSLSEDIRAIKVPFLRIKHQIDRSPFENRVERERCMDVWKILGDRPRKVLRCMLDRLSSQDIANVLSIDVKTVSSHKSTIFKKCRETWDMIEQREINTTWVVDHFAIIHDTIIQEPK